MQTDTPHVLAALALLLLLIRSVIALRIAGRDSGPDRRFGLATQEQPRSKPESLPPTDDGLVSLRIALVVSGYAAGACLLLALFTLVAEWPREIQVANTSGFDLRALLTELRANRAAVEALGKHWHSGGIGIDRLMLVAVFLIVGLACLSRRGADRVFGYALLTVGTLSGSASLIDKFTIERVEFSFGATAEADTVTVPDVVTWRASLDSLADVAGFPLGIEDPRAIPDSGAVALADTSLFRWRDLSSAGGSGHLVVVGSVDRIPLTRAARARYGSELGLARARAERFASLLVERAPQRIPEVSLRRDQIEIQVTAARMTPAGRGDPRGYPSDRTVRVYLAALRPIHHAAERKPRSVPAGASDPLALGLAVAGAALILLADLIRAKIAMDGGKGQNAGDWILVVFMALGIVMISFASVRTPWSPIVLSVWLWLLTTAYTIWRPAANNPAFEG